MAVGSINTSANTSFTGLVDAFKNADASKTVRLDDSGKNLYTSSKIGGAVMNLLANIGVGFAVKARDEARADGLNMVKMAMIEEFGSEVTNQTFKQMEKWHGRSYFEIGNGNAVKVADIREMAQIAKGIVENDQMLDEMNEMIDMDAFSGNIDDIIKGTPLAEDWSKDEINKLGRGLGGDDFAFPEAVNQHVINIPGSSESLERQIDAHDARHQMENEKDNKPSFASQVLDKNIQRAERLLDEMENTISEMSTDDLPDFLKEHLDNMPETNVTDQEHDKNLNALLGEHDRREKVIGDFVEYLKDTKIENNGKYISLIEIDND